MADEIESLLISTKFDTVGLEQSERAIVAAVQGITTAVTRATQGLPPLEFDTSHLRASLKAAGVDVNQFFQSFDAAITDVVAEAGGLEAVSQRIAAAGGRMSQGFAGASEQAAILSAEIRRSVSGSAAMAQGIAAAGAQVNAGTAGFGRHAVSASRAANALTALAASSVGAQSGVGRLAETVLLFSGGLGLAAAGAGAVLVLAKAFEFLTTSERTAQKAQDDLVAGLLQEAATLSATEKAVRGLAAAREQERKARESVITAILRQAAALGQLTADPTASFAGEFRRRDAEALANATKAQAQALRDLQTAERTELTEALSLHIATNAQRERARSLVTLLLSQENALVVPLDRRLEIARQLVALQAALGDQAATQARLALSSQFVAAQNTAQQQGFRAQEQALRAEFAQEAIIRDASLEAELASRADFFQRRRGLARAAAQADIQSLRDQATIAAQAATTGDAEVTARAGKVASLQAEIRLRQGALSLQLQELAAEERLAQLSALDRVGAPAIPTALQPTIALKPRIDLAEIKASIARSAQEFKGSELFQQEIADAAKLAQQIDEVISGLGGIVGAARNVGLIGDEAAQSLGDVLALADALKEVAKSASTGNILGAVAAGINLLGSLGAPSQLDLEHDRILESNSRAIAENTAAVRAATTGGGAASAQATASAAAAIPPRFGPKGIELTDVAGIEKAITDTGLSLRQFEAIVKDTTGLEVLDSEGHLIAATLAQANEALQEYITQITTLSDATDARRRQLEIEDKLGLGGRSADTQVAALERERQVQLDALDLSPAVEANIRALDLNTKEGRAAFLAFEQGLFKAARAGTITAEQLNEFTNVDELVGSVGNAADALAAFTEATNAATQASLNIPQGFKLNRLAFLASDAGPALPPVPRLPMPTPSIDPGRLPRGGDGARLPDFISPSFSLAAGAIVIHAAPGQSEQEIARLVVAELRSLALRQSGDTLHIGSPT